MFDLYELIYVAAIVFFVIGLHRMGHPKTALSGIIWAGWAMAAAIIVSFTIPGISNIPLILMGIAIGGSIGWIAATRVAMVSMPQMVAIYNGMGGGAAAAIAAIELLSGNASVYLQLALGGAIIGSVSLTGSIVAFLKLQGWMKQTPITFPLQQPFNILILAVSAFYGLAYLFPQIPSGIAFSPIYPFFILSLAFGILMTLPIGGADMPVVISMLNALTGLAVAFDGFSTSNFAMVVAGMLVGAAGSILTVAMARAMNRSIFSVLFGAFGKTDEHDLKGTRNARVIEAEDVGIMMAYAGSIIIAPGFGMAAAQAQFRVKELLDILQSRNLQVRFAIHPVAGRMPGHMNVLLAEAGIPYELMVDMDEINRELPNTDVVLVVGANDVVNPAARRVDSPLHGMPILDVDKAKNVIVIKRGAGKGFAGIDNDLFYSQNTRMLYGDASEVIAALIQSLKKL